LSIFHVKKEISIYNIALFKDVKQITVKIIGQELKKGDPGLKRISNFLHSNSESSKKEQLEVSGRSLLGKMSD